MAKGSTPTKLVIRDGWRFSLRAALILVLIAALPLAWIANWRRSKLREHAAAKRLEELGVAVMMRRPERLPGARDADEPWYAVLLPPNHTNLVVWIRANRGLQLNAEITELLLELPHLERLDLNGENFHNNPSRAPLRSLPQLSMLKIGRKNPIDCFLNQRNLRELEVREVEDVESCRQLLRTNQRLTTLTLYDVSTGDAIAPLLARLQHVEDLYLSHTKLTSAGVLQLRDLKSLQQLSLNGKEIDDAAIPAILQLNSLRYLSIYSTNVSESGREEILRALPQCKLR